MHAGPLGCGRGDTSILTQHGLSGGFAGHGLRYRRAHRQHWSRHQRWWTQVVHAHSCRAYPYPLLDTRGQQRLQGQSTGLPISIQQRAAEAGPRRLRALWRCQAAHEPSTAGGGGGANGSAPVESGSGADRQQTADQDGAAVEPSRPPPKVPVETPQQCLCDPQCIDTDTAACHTSLDK